MQPRDFFLRTKERVQNSRGKRAISVRATEVLLYTTCFLLEHKQHDLSQKKDLVKFKKRLCPLRLI